MICFFRNQFSRRLRHCAWAFGLLALSTYGASAQSEEKPLETLNWIIECQSSAESVDLACAMSQRITDSKTGVMLLIVSVQYQSSNASSAILINLAHGFHVPSGLTLQIDDGAEINLPFETSNAQGLVSASALSLTQLAEMRTAKVLKVSAIQYSPRTKVVLPISLSGFAAAQEKLTQIE